MSLIIDSGFNIMKGGFMFKIQYPTDHLKKESVNSKIAELSDEIQYMEQVKEFPQFKRYRRSDVDSESRFKRIDVPGDGSCLFWSVTMAYLIPVRNNDALFQRRYEALFGNEGDVTQSLDHIRGLVRNLSTADYDDTFVNLVRNVFRNRVVNYISAHENEFRNFVEGESGLSFKDYLENMRKLNTWGGEPEIRAMSGMLSATISVSGEVPLPPYGNGDIQIQLFRVGAPGNRNHYNFGLERNIISNDKELAKGLKKVMGKGRPQDFELIQLLIEEVGKEVATNKQDEDFKSFETRFQSFVDQIPSYLHSVEKAGFFTPFFLGSFSTLLDTEMAKKLDIKEIYFSFDGAKTLKVAIIKNGEIKSQKNVIDKVKLFIISESGSHSYTQEFDQGELRKVLGKHYSFIEDHLDKIKVKSIEVIKDAGHQEEIVVDVKDKGVDIEHNSEVQFKKVRKGLWRDPEVDIAKLAISNQRTVKASLRRILDKIYTIHSEYADSLIYASRAREAAHHGFMVGVFMNFHYRYNLKVYPEQFAGRGYADIILLARGPDRALNSVPIIIEVKAGEGPNATPDKALQQAEKYAQGFQPNVQRVLTTADEILCVGVNLDNPSPVSDVRVSNRGEEIIPLFQDMLKSADDWDTQRIGTIELKGQVKDNLERIYHTFPGTPEKGDNHYFSRFLLGQSLLLNRVEDLKTGFKKYIFIYGDNIPTEVHPNLREFGRPAAKRARERLSTNLDASHAVVTMVLIPGNTEKLVYVINIVEANRKDVLNGLDEVLPLDRLNREIGDREIIELNLNFDTRYKSDFKRYLTIWTEKYNSLQEYNNGDNRFQGTFKEVTYPNELKETFDKALDIQSLSIRGYSRLLEKIGEGIFPFKSLVNKEAHFQGILNGVFSYYSDLKLQESPETRALVLTEFQTGRGERIDVLVHGIKFVAQGGNAEEYTPIGLELKASRQGKGAQALLREANDQINEEYKEGVTYKTLTDGDEVKFIGVVFDKGSNNPNKLILTSRTAKEGFIPVEVVHSSVHMLPTVGQCSKRKSSSEYPPSKKPRRERSVSMACIDSFDEEEITEEEKEQRIKELFNADKVAERVKNIEFYDQLFKFSQKISEGEIIDKNVEEAFVAKIKDVDLNSIDPEIRDIVKEMKDNIENKEEVKNILRRSGVAEKIGKVAEGAGLAFTAFLVGKHIANGDIEGLGYDALNLWVMPKIGEKISGKILELGTKLDSQMLKGFAPAMGRAIGNFAAFLGLAESIKARQNAIDPVDIKIADLNIATNSIFIAADVPAVVTETMSAIGMEAGVIGEFAGPVGAAISVAVIIIAQFVEAGLEVEKLEEHIKLTDQEKHDLYWDFFLDKKVPDYIGNDLQAEEIYKQYISKILNQFKSNYDTIAISLPSILVTKEEYATSARSRDKRQWEGYGLAFGQALNGVLNECRAKTRIVNDTFDFESSTNITYPFYTSSIKHNTRIIPSIVENYNVVCGPRGDDIAVEIVSKKTLANLPDGASCSSASQYNDMKLSRIVERWLLQEHLSNCYNAVVYKNKNSREYGSVYYIPAQNANVNIVFQEKDALNDDRNRRRENRNYFEKSLDSCKVHNPGSNFFYITGKFSCDLGADGQKNIVVTQGNFTDSENIHSIIGSDKANHIEVSHAGYIDGKGGNDVITAKNFTVIKGYFGDSIYGKGLVLLPINFSDIGSMTHANNIINIHNKSGAFISVDKQTSVKTADGLFVTPTKVDMNTDRVTNVHITKLDNKLDNLRKMENSNFNITKQLLNANYHGVVGSSSNHIFSPDEDHHNFYWKAPSNISHLYLFDNRNANIMIAQANGILDFSLLNSTLNDMPFIEDNKGEIKINKNGLNVTLLSNYKDVTVTFNGEEYYKLQNGELERDYCSHSLKIDGRFSVNGTELLNHHNCFTFDSDKVLFLKLNNDLLLLSDGGALSISNYYSSVHKNWDLSIGLNNRVMEPEEFGERADDFSSFRYYKPDKQGLQIYHNQPINKNDIGLVDLKGKSILDFDMKVMNDTLLLSHKNNTLVKVENWNTYQPAREVMFAFNDATVSNSKCIASTCNSEDVIVEFNKEKEQTNLDKELLTAVQDGGFNKVQGLINRGANVNAKDKDGKTPLHYASRSDHHLGMVKYLISKGADIDVKDNSGRTPEDEERYTNSGTIRQVFMQAHLDKELLLTVKNEKDLKTISDLIVKDIDDRTHGGFYYTWSGNLGTVEFLVSKDVSVNATDKYGCTLLHWSALKGHSDIAKFLVDRGANVNAKDILGRTPMHFAVMNNHKDIQDVYGRGPTYTTAESNDEEIVQLFLMKGASVNEADENGETPLHLASWDGHLGILQHLINNGANIGTKDSSGKTPLDIARDKGHNNIVQYLQQTQSSLNRELLTAVRGGDLNKVKDFIGRGASLDAKDEYGRTLLHWASWNGNLDAVKYLIGEGASIQAEDRDGKTPLDIAIDQRHDSVAVYLQQTQLDLNKQLLFAVRGNDFNKVKDLVSKGASVDTKDSDGWTLLHHTARRGYLEVAEFLIEKGADINAEDKYGKKPIQRAAEDNNKNIITLLLSKGVNINDTDKNGRTSLYWASYNGNLDAVKYLISQGASIQAGDKGGKTPLDIARDKGYNNIVNYLEEELNKEREKPVQRRRRHHHGDHARHHMSRKPLAIDSSNQPEIATSSAIKPSSWINGLLGWVKSSIGGLVSSVADKFAAEESENSKLGDTGPCSAGLEKMYSATILQSRKSLDAPKGNIPNRSWSSNQEKVRSNVTVVPEINIAVVDSALILGDLAVRFMNGTRYEQPIHENLLSPREQSMRSIDEGMIIRAIQQGKEKFGVPSTNMDEVEIIGNKTEIGK